jgi:hypothetical protein
MKTKKIRNKHKRPSGQHEPLVIPPDTQLEMRKRQGELREEIQKIGKQLEDANRVETIKKLKTHIGKYYKHDFGMRVVYVTGVDEESLRNWTITVGLIGEKNETPWLSFETESNIYEMEKLLPATRKEFFYIFNKIKKCVGSV